MLDLHYVRENLDAVKTALQNRNFPIESLEKFAELDAERRRVISESDNAKSELNRVSKEIGDLSKPKANLNLGDLVSQADKVGTIAGLKLRAAIIKPQIAGFDKKRDESELEMRELLSALPNIPASDVPVGTDEAANVEIRKWGEPKTFDFEPKDHVDLGENLGILDLERATKITGSRFAILNGAGARLSRALVNFMLDVHTTEHGYSETLPPFIVNSKSLFGTGQLPKFESDLFKLTDNRFGNADKIKNNKSFQKFYEKLNSLENTIIPDNVAFDEALGYLGMGDHEQFGLSEDEALEILVLLITTYAEVNGAESLKNFSVDEYERQFYLIPTAEVPVTNYHAEEILSASDLPKYYTAYTPCFRSEAGSYGRDTRGLIRQHQFEKVELVKLSLPENSVEEHEKLTANAETILRKLGLPYRTVVLSTGDMGFGAVKTYDIEVWMPSQNTYREISSCSNCGDFQARRMNLRFRRSGGAKPEFVHTLNGSGLAVGRTWIAILENYQQADGSIVVPEILQPYMNNLERIEK